MGNLQNAGSGDWSCRVKADSAKIMIKLHPGLGPRRNAIETDRGLDTLAINYKIQHVFIPAGISQQIETAHRVEQGDCTISDQSLNADRADLSKMTSIIIQQIGLRRISPSSYSINWHHDWNVGFFLHGGHIAAAIHHAAVTHLKSEPELAKLEQFDILKLHFEFLRSLELCESTITITTLKLGAGTSLLQLDLSQNGRHKVLALATSINFDRSFGPSVGIKSSPLVPTIPIPNFDLIHSNKPEQNWLATQSKGEVIPYLSRLLMLLPRQGLPVDGMIDIWSHWKGEIPRDPFYLTLMCDCFPSMSDTLLRNNGLFDARKNHEKLVRWDEENPGITATLPTTAAEAMKAQTFNSTLTLDIEFKRRVPEKGLSWLFTRLASRSLQGGRLDLDIALYDEKMELLAVANQLILVLDIKRRFLSTGKKGNL